MIKHLPFSLVTTCRNEIFSIHRWKDNILAQTRPPDEIVIVDAFSDDGTIEYLKDWADHDPRLRIIQKKGSPARGRNVAIFNAQHEIILSTDMGVGISPIWCAEIIEKFENNDKVEVVAGNSCIDLETVKTPIAWAEFYIENGGFLKLGPGRGAGNRSVAYTKTVWKQLGGLPEDLTFYADDQTFVRQMLEAKLKFEYAYNAMTYWGRPATPREFFKEMYNYGRGDGEALIKVPRAVKWYRTNFFPKLLVPFFSGTFNLIKNFSFRTFYRALKERGFRTALWIPALLFARCYYHSKGYLLGMHWGDINCVSCRSRLTRNEYGYPIIQYACHISTFFLIVEIFYF